MPNSHFKRSDRATTIPFAKHTAAVVKRNLVKLLKFRSFLKLNVISKKLAKFQISSVKIWKHFDENWIERINEKGVAESFIKVFPLPPFLLAAGIVFVLISALYWFTICFIYCFNSFIKSHPHACRCHYAFWLHHIFSISLGLCSLSIIHPHLYYMLSSPHLLQYTIFSRLLTYLVLGEPEKANTIVLS